LNKNKKLKKKRNIRERVIALFTKNKNDIKSKTTDSSETNAKRCIRN
jgi:hypothetical protein